jgi:hypothetical protein
LTTEPLQVFRVNIALTVGGSETTVNVSAAPPPLETTNATLGQTMEAQTYQSLPLNMGGALRDPTAFIYLTPGVISDGRSGSSMEVKAITMRPTSKDSR